MRVPHTIERSTLLAYGIVNREEPKEVRATPGRLLVAEDTKWDSGQVASLFELCTRSLPATLIPVLPCEARNYLLETLSVNLPLPFASRVIPDGIYWKRRCEKRWGSANNVAEADGDWKRLYLEKHTQELVECLLPDGSADETIDTMCETVSDYVLKLKIRQLQVQPRFLDPENDEEELGDAKDRIHLNNLLVGLQSLQEIHIQFGMKNIGSNYRSILFEFTAQDCRNLGDGVAAATRLRLLRIHQCSLDDTKLSHLLTHMQPNVSLEALEFPHCLIGDEGAAALAKFLTNKPKLRRLDISNNQVKKIGIQALSFLLTQQNGCGMIDLNVSLNDFGDEGAQFLLSALQRQAPSLRMLNISCASLGEDAGILLGDVLSRNRCLLNLNASNNSLGAVAGAAILQGMRSNETLQFCDLRMTGVTDEDQIELEKLLHINRCHGRSNSEEK